MLVLYRRQLGEAALKIGTVDMYSGEVDRDGVV